MGRCSSTAKSNCAVNAAVCASYSLRAVSGVIAALSSPISPTMARGFATSFSRSSSSHPSATLHTTKHHRWRRWSSLSSRTTTLRATPYY
jgi:hypothetical protein